VVPRRQHAGGHADEHGDDDGEDREQQRRLQPVEDGLGHGLAEKDGAAEIPLQQPAVPAQELDVERLVHPQRMGDLADVVRGGVGTGDDGGGVARRQVDEHEAHSGHHQRHRDQRQQAPDDVGLHGPATLVS
jgi:hypothetical protein